MRIGIFADSYLPTLNGVSVSVETFRKEMEKKGHQYFIFAPEKSPYDTKYEDPDAKEGGPEHVFRYPSFVTKKQKNYPIAKPWILFHTNEVIHLVKNLNLDIIHAQHLAVMGNAGRIAGHQLGIPVVYTYHTLITEYTHHVPIIGGFLKGAIVFWSRWFCNHCDQIITPSKPMKEILESYGVTKPIEVVPTGIHPEKLLDHLPEKYIRAKWDIPEGTKILLYVSRIEKEKNIEFLFKAIALLVKFREQNSGKIDFHLLMVGGGAELASSLELVKKMGLNNVITFTDMIDKETVNRYFGAADIFVFPSITETQGIVVCEAMAAGVPVVAVNRMGPKDIIENNVNGYLTDLNIGAFVAKINKLLSDDNLCRQMAKKAKSRADSFSSLASANKMEKLYAKTIQQFKQTIRDGSKPKSS